MAIQTLLAKPGFRPLDRIHVEMNLLEFPIATYNRRHGKTVKSITVERAMPDGREFKWEVSGSATRGLPVPEDLDHFLVLLHEGDKHVETGPQYHFSFWKWAEDLDLDPTSGHVLKGLHRTLERLVGATVYARGCWYDEETGQRITIHEPFHLLEGYQLFERRKNARQVDLQLNWVRLSQPFFRSIRAGYMRNIDFGFYKTLPSHLTKQLYLHLLKLMGRKPELDYGLEKLRANIAYPLMPGRPDETYRELIRALNILGARGFMCEMRILGRGKDAQLVISAADPVKMRKATSAVRTGVQLSLLS